MSNPLEELKQHERQQLAQVSEYSDIHSEPITIDNAPGFRLSYRHPQQAYSVSRIAFVRNRHRHVIIIVRNGVTHTDLSDDIRVLLDSIRFQAGEGSTGPTSN